MRHPFPFNSMRLRSARFRRRLYLFAACIFYVLMVAFGSIPGEAEALSAVVYDKLLHFTAYAILSTLIFSGLKGSQLRRALASLLLAGLLGGLDEAIQSFLPYRSAGMADWVFDMLAAAASVMVLTLLHSLNAFVRRRRIALRSIHAGYAATNELTLPKFRKPR